jgi:ABC-type multidrug transport system fused ATPase/permease subunit
MRFRFLKSLDSSEDVWSFKDVAAYTGEKRTAIFVEKNKTISWKILGQILKQHVWSGPRWVIFLAAISMIVAALSTAALTQWVKPMIDDIFIGHRADRLMYISLGVFVIFSIRGLSDYASNRCTDFMGERLVRSLQTQLFQHAIAMNIDFFRENHEGSLISLLTHDVRVIRRVLVQTMVGLLNRSLMVIFLAITMVQSSFTMLWIALWLLPVTGFLLTYCQKKSRYLNEKLAFQISDLSVFFQQIFQNIVLVKSSNTECKEVDNMDQRMQSLWDKAIAFSKLQNSIHPIMDVVAGLSIAVGVFFVGQEVMSGQQTVGAFFTFIMALVFIYPPIKMIVSLNTQMQEGLVSAKRIHDLLATPTESSLLLNAKSASIPYLDEVNQFTLGDGSKLKNRANTQSQKQSMWNETAGIGKIKADLSAEPLLGGTIDSGEGSSSSGLPSSGLSAPCNQPALDPKGRLIPNSLPNALAHHDLVFENVTFQYPKAAESVFQDFSCRFLCGKKMALVGNSGAGKTTLFYLLLQLYKPESGCIFIGDRDLQNIPVNEWRKNIAFVGQEMALFSDTVAENIAYGLVATRDEVQQAAAMAYADEFIESLPQGYDTMIGTRGLMLSGGQRQRLALARAFLRNSPIVLLDEATSALDATSEKKIKEATFRLMEKRTTIMIAHRFSTIEAADKIFVLDQGRVKQEGCHHELMLQKGLYQQWAKMQQL